MIMKKTYIAPQLANHWVAVAPTLMAGSITNVVYDGSHDIDIDGSAADGDESDSRSFSIWDEE
jgi:hypothetical protein